MSDLLFGLRSEICFSGLAFSLAEFAPHAAVRNAGLHEFFALANEAMALIESPGM